MDYLTVNELKAQVPSNLTDEILSAIITRESAHITSRLGAESTDSVTQKFQQPSQTTKIITLAFVPDVISEVKEDGVTLDPNLHHNPETGISDISLHVKHLNVAIEFETDWRSNS